MKLFTLRMHFKFNHNLIDLHMYMNSDKVEKRRKNNRRGVGGYSKIEEGALEINLN